MLLVIYRSIFVLLLTGIVFLIAMLMWGVEYSDLTLADKMIISLLLYLLYFRFDLVYPEVVHEVIDNKKSK